MTGGKDNENRVTGGETDQTPDEEQTVENGGGEPAAESAREPDQIAEMAEEIAALRDRLLRAVAETENVRKRGQRQLEEARRYGASDLAKDLLNVADNLRRAIDSVPKEAIGESDALAKLIDGLAAVERDFLQAFENHNITRIADAGVPFDHNVHQAMFELPGTGKPSGTVVELLQVGYMLHDRLLRPAMVGVAAQERKPNGGGDQNGSDEPGKRVDTTA